MSEILNNIENQLEKIYEMIENAKIIIDKNTEQLLKLGYTLLIDDDAKNLWYKDIIINNQKLAIHATINHLCSTADLELRIIGLKFYIGVRDVSLFENDHSYILNEEQQLIKYRKLCIKKEDN